MKPLYERFHFHVQKILSPCGEAFSARSAQWMTCSAFRHLKKESLQGLVAISVMTFARATSSGRRPGLGCFVVANCRVRNVKEQRRFAVVLRGALLRCLNFGLPRPDPSFASAPGEFCGFAFREGRV